MSVGKTTLVNALKELSEFKNYTFRTERSKYLRDMGIPLNTDSTVKGQSVFLAERASELMQENIITDRDGRSSFILASLLLIFKTKKTLNIATLTKYCYQ